MQPPPDDPDVSALDAKRPAHSLIVGQDLQAADLHSQIDEGERLRFARQVLLALFVISLVAFGGYYIWPESRASAAVFELVKVGMLPLVTLVIAFYFPNSRK